MDFELSGEQRLLKDSIERLMADRYTFEARNRFMAEADGFSRDLWRHYAELGLLGLSYSEEHGGIGGGPVETMIVMEAFGRALALEPYLATVVLSGGLIDAGGNAALRDDLLPRIASGEMRLAFAHAERQARYCLSDVAATARQDGTGYMLEGAKTLVLHGDSADRFVVSARLSGDRRDEAGIGLFLVDAGATGLSRRGYPTVDGLRAAELALDGVRVSSERVIGTPGEAFPLIDRVVARAIAAICAEAVGAMEVLHGLTVDYLKTRRQFGKPIGDFQVLQHRAAEMLVALEQARSMAMFAAMMADDPDAAARRRAISAAKVQIGHSGRLIGQQAIQLHGGIGMTMEYSAGHYFKRLTAINTLFGDADHHLLQLARMDGGLIAA
ncbi:MAG: acyl-CoA dehydrogenase family protein [Pseudorhodoplanes sp.]|nr:acyl-CoA dehydrogenase family protein [Pseudorhodoplanes sp.]